MQEQALFSMLPTLVTFYHQMSILISNKDVSSNIGLVWLHRFSKHVAKVRLETLALVDASDVRHGSGQKILETRQDKTGANS